MSTKACTPRPICNPKGTNTKFTSKIIVHTREYAGMTLFPANINVFLDSVAYLYISMR